MDWNVTVKNVGILGIFSLLLVVAVGPALTKPLYRSPSAASLGRINSTTDSSASTAEVLRNVQTLLHITKPLGGKRKWVKQEEAAAAGGSDGSANALAYLTDSFGGQIAGQVISLILASVTGDVRGILGNSLNLFQDDDRRDRVQVFLDDISKNFLQFTGLGLLTTTKPPLQQQQPTLYPGAPVFGSGQTLQSGQIPASSGGGGGFAPASNGASGGIFATAAQTILNSQQQQNAQATAQQQPVIYVLPQLGNTATGGSDTSSGTATNTGNNKVVSNVGDDDSEEDRK